VRWAGTPWARALAPPVAGRFEPGLLYTVHQAQHTHTPHAGGRGGTR
jgi:hypothetical protein